MEKTNKPYETIIDFVTGRPVPDIGAEANRQALERFLVDRKEFDKNDIEVDAELKLDIRGESYRSRIDLIIRIDGIRFMAVKCAAGSLGSREREILSAARLLDSYQIPFSAVSDGKTATILDTCSGKRIGEGLQAFPTRREAVERLKAISLQPLSEERVEREKLIFRSYDSMNVNRS